MLEARSLTKYYGPLPALRDASFIAKPGQFSATSAQRLRQVDHGPHAGGPDGAEQRRRVVEGPVPSSKTCRRFASSSATFRKSRFSTRTSPLPNICASSAGCAAWTMRCSRRRIERFLDAARTRRRQVLHALRVFERHAAESAARIGAPSQSRADHSRRAIFRTGRRRRVDAAQR